MEALTLEAALSGLIGGTLTYPAAKYIFTEIDSWREDGEYTAKQKRFISLAISFGLSAVALGVAALLGVAAITPETIFTAGVSAFTASQTLHGLLAMPGTS